MQAALGHPQDPPTGCHVTLEEAGALQALTTAIHHLGKPPDSRPVAPPPQLATFTAAMATLLALMRPCNLPLLLGTEDQATAAKWRVELTKIFRHIEVRRWLVYSARYCGPSSPASGGLPLGAAATLLIALNERIRHVAWDAHRMEPASAVEHVGMYVQAVNAFYGMGAQGQPLLHHVALLGMTLENSIRINNGATASALANHFRNFQDNGDNGDDADPMSRLVRRPLQHLQCLPGSTCRLTQQWRWVAYTTHTSALAMACKWVASREGMPGLKALAAGGLAELAVEVADKLLYEEEATAELLQPLQGQALEWVAHMAATSEGRACLAQDARLCYWLARGPQLDSKVRLKLAIATLSSVVDRVTAGEPYWCSLFPSDGSSNTERMRPLTWGGIGSQRCVALAEQLAAPTGQEAMAALLDGHQGSTKGFVEATLLKALGAVVPDASALTPKAEAAFGTKFRRLYKPPQQ